MQARGAGPPPRRAKLTRPVNWHRLSLTPAAGMFTPTDLDDLAQRHIAVADAERQLARFRTAPPPAALDRPCTVGDGVLSLDATTQSEMARAGADLLATGRVAKFVPASGAATRMFQSLQADPGGPAARDVRAHLDRFAFAPQLESEPDAIAAIVRRFAPLPKALLAFHRYGDQSRTAFEEHLREGLQLGVRSQHFTVAPEHRHAFEALAGRSGLPVAVTFSEQKASTDTLAGQPGGGPFRDRSGRLVFRPGGHGALLENLSDLQGDVLLIKNVDNITHERLWAEQLRWKAILLGVLQRERAADRPTRVCGVVRNTGEPGGGPFWVRGRDGRVTPQIVEAAEVDATEPGQARVFEAATHFNPVDLACAVRDDAGRPWDLRRFRDDEAVFVSEKSRDGQPLLALELPGLWNGAMAHWHTVFVEVPLGTFNPVKTLTDLLKPAHQPA